MIKVKQKGDFNNIERFFNRVLKRNYLNILADYANRGVEALKEATPTESGETANSWGYEIESADGITTIYFTNNSINEGANVVILLIYGHGLWNGGYVEPNDFVTPAIRPIFEELADKMWKEVTE